MLDIFFVQDLKSSPHLASPAGAGEELAVCVTNYCCNLIQLSNFIYCVQCDFFMITTCLN